jgi:hypothetical protein
MRRRTILPLIVGLLVWGCDDQAEPSADGTLAVSTTTVGDDLDPDGFQLRIDGIDSLALLPTGTAEVALSVGRHTLQLFGVAEHCSVVPGTSVEVDITEGRTAPVTFQVSCPGTRLGVAVTTTGNDPDQDGYNLTIDGVDALTLNPTGSALVNVAPGRHTLQLQGVAEQCSVTPGTLIELEFARGRTTGVTYAVDCPETILLATVTATGQGVDIDGFTLTVDGEEVSQLSNATVSILIDPGSRTIALIGVAPNCTIDGPASRTVIIVAGTTTPIEFVVACSATTASRFDGHLDTKP